MRKSLWSPDEDEKLRSYVATHGCGNWSDVAKQTGLQRCGKSCRLRWINYLRPDLKRGPFSAQEVRLVVNLHNSLGNSWSKIATHLPGRTDNDVKNFWHSYTRSRRMQQQQQQIAESNRRRQEASIKCGEKSLSNSHLHYGKSDTKEDMINRSGAPYADNLLQMQPFPSLPIEELTRRGTKDSLEVFNIAAPGNPNAYQPAASYSMSTALSQKTFHPITLTDSANQISLSYTARPESHLHIPSQHSGPEVPHILSDHKPLSVTPDLQSAEATISTFYKVYHPNTIHNQISCRKVPQLSFQHFPPLIEALDQSNLKNVQSFIDDISCSTVKKQSNNALGGVYAQAPGSGSLVTQAGRNLSAYYTAVKDELGADLIKAPEGLESVIWSFLKGQPVDEAGDAAEYTSNHDYCNLGDDINPSDHSQHYSYPTGKAQILAANNSSPTNYYPNYQQLVAPDQLYINIVEPL